MTAFQIGLLIIIGIITYAWTVNRICRCAESCAQAKAMADYLSKNEEAAKKVMDSFEKTLGGKNNE